MREQKLDDWETEGLTFVSHHCFGTRHLRGILKTENDEELIKRTEEVKIKTLTLNWIFSMC